MDKSVGRGRGLFRPARITCFGDPRNTRYGDFGAAPNDVGALASRHFFIFLGKPKFFYLPLGFNVSLSLGRSHRTD